MNCFENFIMGNMIIVQKCNMNHHREFLQIISVGKKNPLNALHRPWIGSETSVHIRIILGLHFQKF